MKKKNNRKKGSLSDQMSSRAEHVVSSVKQDLTIRAGGKSPAVLAAGAIPYILFFYVVNRASWLYRHCRGDSAFEKAVNMLIFHNPYQLISLLTTLYGEFTYSQIKETGILQRLFDSQYSIGTYETIETTTEIVEITDPDTGETVEEEQEKEIRILNITLRNHGFDTVARSFLPENGSAMYTLLNNTYGNRSYLFDLEKIRGFEGIIASSGSWYQIPQEALSDARFARMIREAEKYLGYPYVWGGSSPGTSFDCSGFVCWVVNHCGNGWNVGRTTAEGLRSYCAYVPKAQARPGDLIFFQGTYNTAGASHIGIYVEDGMMIHCGNPIQYTSINTSYWQAHFMAFGRLHN